MEKLILKFELDRKQMISANDRLHFQKKAKITKFLRQLAHYEGQNTLRAYFGLPYNEDKPCKVIVWVYAPTNRIYDPPNWSPTSKALLDGLTDAKFWTDDNYHVLNQWILGTVESQEVKNTELNWRSLNGKKRTSES